MKIAHINTPNCLWLLVKFVDRIVRRNSEFFIVFNAHLTSIAQKVTNFVPYESLGSRQLEKSSNSMI